MQKRGSGLLLHISSLPSRYGIGDFGGSAHSFVDFLAQAGQRYWQILPVSPVFSVYGNSPYSSPSAFAMNPLLIDPEGLVEAGWLEAKNITPVAGLRDGSVDYAAVRKFKDKIFAQSFQRFKKEASNDPAYQEFCSDHSFWLEDYAAYLVFKSHFQERAWHQWPTDVRDRRPQAMLKLRNQFSEEMEKVKFLQFVAYGQWQVLKARCRDKGVQIIGDIPIYVNDDSADVWSHRDIFKLDKDLKPRYVAGVPPDYFSATGQLWGNPVYDWERLKQDKYAWWVKRLHHNMRLFDVTRIDHFRGFVAYWQVDRHEPTAINGRWVPGPGDDFFNLVKKELPDLPIIVEDLGTITPDVTALIKRFGFPGMKVMLFAFDGDGKTHPYLPENYDRNCVGYTGTHDNNTIYGWLKEEAGVEQKEKMKAYLGQPLDHPELHWLLIERLLRSKAERVIVPLQDVLGLGKQARMNVPATMSKNWCWRFRNAVLTDKLAARLKALASATRR